MLTERARRWTAALVGPLAEALAGWGVHPNVLTVAGSLLHVGVLALLAGERPLWLGALALAVAAAFDGLDGAVARHTGRVSPFGAFLDSTMDRVSETLVFLGLLARALRLGDDALALLALVALAGSLMVSYTRARSEGIGHGTVAGAFGRLERMLLLIGGLAVGFATPTLALLAAGAWATVAARVLDVARSCREAEAAATGGEARHGPSELPAEARPEAS